MIHAGKVDQWNIFLRLLKLTLLSFWLSLMRLGSS